MMETTKLMIIIIMAAATNNVDWQSIVAIVIATLGGGGGVVVAVKAILDYRLKMQAQLSNRDDKLIARMEKRIFYTDNRVEQLEAEIAEERLYSAILSRTLALNGLDIPEKPEEKHD